MFNRNISTSSKPACRVNGRAASLGIVLFITAMILLFSPIIHAQEPLEPPSKPDAESGAPIFADRCANCHGVSGQGDGEMTDRLPKPPRDFTSAEFRKTAVPAQMYRAITEGNLDAGMPPFGPASSNPIAEADRWDLTAMVYSLGTPPETIEAGQAIYKANCLSCHGENGQGDGPEASDQQAEPTDLTDLRYWSSRSNEMVFTALQDEGIEGHTYTLGDEDLWDVTDYSRTFAYEYYDPAAALEPIKAAIISGIVTNGSTGEIIGDGSVNLRAFTMDLEEVLSETTAIQADGSYRFELSDVDPELVYMTSAEYGDLIYNSSPDRLTRDEPELDMPIVVFEGTTDPGVVNIEQIHMVLEFIEDQVMVNEIYVINNDDTAVFLGETGDTADGTFELVLPSGAENVNFQRSFGSGTNFMSAPEMIQTDRGWADTDPLRPGQGAVNLLVSYQIPFVDGMKIAHPVYYDTANATIIMPDVGVSLRGDEWVSQGAQQMGAAGTFQAYALPGLEADEALSFELEGRINSTAMANVVGPQDGIDSTTGLIIGASVLLLVVVGAILTMRSWQSAQPVQDSMETEQLLQAVANLDDAFEAGVMDESQYLDQRDKLMSELHALWSQGDS